jgi:hypothetical protein
MMGGLIRRTIRQLSVHDLVIRFALVPWRFKLLAFAVVVVLVELGLRRFARGSRLYAGWKGFFEAIGAVWTAVLLAIIYVLSVGPIGLVMRLAGSDPLDRQLAPEPSFWRPHEPNPLGTEAAARHQF